MKNTLPKSFLRADKVFQIILGAAMLCCIVFFPLMGIPFFILGVWQVISAIYLVAQYNDKPRKQYLLVVLGWAVVMSAMYFFGVFGAPWFTMFLLIPLCIAIWYFNQTYSDWKNAGEPTERLDNVLDFKVDEL